jgi:hypothetical protein
MLLLSILMVFAPRRLSSLNSAPAGSNVQHRKTSGSVASGTNPVGVQCGDSHRRGGADIVAGADWIAQAEKLRPDREAGERLFATRAVASNGATPGLWPAIQQFEIVL